MRRPPDERDRRCGRQRTAGERERIPPPWRHDELGEADDRPLCRRLTVAWSLLNRPGRYGPRVMARNTDRLGPPQFTAELVRDAVLTSHRLASSRAPGGAGQLAGNRFRLPSVSEPASASATFRKPASDAIGRVWDERFRPDPCVRRQLELYTAGPGMSGERFCAQGRSGRGRAAGRDRWLVGCGQPVAALGLGDLACLRQLGERGADGPAGEACRFGDIAGGHRPVGRERAEYLGLGRARRRPGSRARLAGGTCSLARRGRRWAGSADGGSRCGTFRRFRCPLARRLRCRLRSWSRPRVEGGERPAKLLRLGDQLLKALLDVVTNAIDQLAFTPSLEVAGDPTSRRSQRSSDASPSSWNQTFSCSTVASSSLPQISRPGRREPHVVSS